MLDKIFDKIKNKEVGKGQEVIGDSVINYNITDNGYSISVVTTPKSANNQDTDEVRKNIDKYVIEFKKSLEEIDDNIFSKSCESFGTLCGYSINQLSDILDNSTNFNHVRKCINDFKRAVNIVLVHEINKLRSQFYKLGD